MKSIPYFQQWNKMRKINIVGLTVLIIVTEDYTWVYRGRVTKVKKLSEYQRAQVLLDKTFID